MNFSFPTLSNVCDIWAILPFSFGRILEQELSHLCVQHVIWTPRTLFLAVWTPKCLGQDLLMMTIFEDSASSVTASIQTKQLLA